MAPSDENAEVDRLVREFVDLTERQFDAEDIEDFKAGGVAVRRKLQLVKELDAIRADARIALLPLLEHPHPGVRAEAGVFLCRMMPDRVLPVLRKLANMKTLEELTAPHGLNASYHASRAIWFYENGYLKI